MPSRTALVLANQGDPIFGAIRGLISGGIRTIRGVGRLIRGQRQISAVGTQIARSPATGQIVRIAKSKVARVAAEAVGFGAIAGATSIAARRAIGERIPGIGLEGEFISGPTGCPTGKVVNVAAHQRIIPLDRFGRPRRRIDVLNTKALSRATRRLGGFQKRARRVEKQLARIAPRTRSRRRSKGVC